MEDMILPSTAVKVIGAAVERMSVVVVVRAAV